MELGDRAEIDGEGELDLLAFAQAEVARLDEHAGGAQVHGSTELSAAARDRDVDGCSCPVPRVQAAFHLVSCLALSSCCSCAGRCHYADVTLRNAANST